MARHDSDKRTPICSMNFLYIDNTWNHQHEYVRNHRRTIKNRIISTDGGKVT